MAENGPLASKRLIEHAQSCRTGCREGVADWRAAYAHGRRVRRLVGVVVVRRGLWPAQLCGPPRPGWLTVVLSSGVCAILFSTDGEPRFERLDEHDVHAVEAEQLKIFCTPLDDAIGAMMRIVGLSVGWEPTVHEGNSGRSRRLQQRWPHGSRALPLHANTAQGAIGLTHRRAWRWRPSR